MVEPLHRHVLTQRGQNLQDALDAFKSLTHDSCNLLTRMTKQLAMLGATAQPIHAHSARLRRAEQHITAAKSSTDLLLQHLHTPKKLEPVIRQGPGRDLDGYLDLLNKLHVAMQHLEQHPSLPVAQQAYAHALQVQQRALRDCETDFVSVLTQQTNATLPAASTLVQAAEMEALPASVSSPILPDFAPKPLARLKALGVLLQDYSDSSVTSYVQVRAKALSGVLHAAGAPVSLSTTSAQLHSLEHAEKLAAGWNLQLRMLTAACAIEVALARAVWGAEVGGQVVGGVVVSQLQDLTQQCREMCKTGQQPFKVFVLLDMIKHMEAVMPLLERLLMYSSTAEKPLQALQDAQDGLGSTARELFGLFESGIARDSSRAQAVDGTVHPLTASTLAYLRRLFTYGPVVQVLFLTGGRGGGAMAELNEQVAAKRMFQAVRRCMDGLVQALEVKSKAYKSKALGAIFIMNNVHYMVSTVEQSDEMSMLGRPWVEQHRDLIEKHGQSYHELVWMPVVRHLRAVQDGSDPKPADHAKWKEWVKRHFKTVNDVMEKVGNEQSAWHIPDDKLRSAVCSVILQDFLPPYTHFWNTYSRADFTAARNKYVRCSPDDVENIVKNSLFMGKPMTVTLARVQRSPGPSTEHKQRGLSLPPVPDDGSDSAPSASRHRTRSSYMPRTYDE